MEIVITDESLKKNLSAAILATIGTKGQEVIIQQAVDGVIAKTVLKDRYGNPTGEGPSVVEQHFGNAVGFLARDIINDLVKNDPEVRKTIEKFVRESLLITLDKDLGDGPSPIRDAFAGALATAFTGNERY